MLFGQGDHKPIVSRRRLQLEIERPAKTLAKRKTPRSVDPRPERGMNDQLHTATLVKKTFGHDATVSWKHAQLSHSGGYVS